MPALRIAIAGQITDARNQPLPGADVRVLLHISGKPPQAVADARTDERGTYTATVGFDGEPWPLASIEVWDASRKVGENNPQKVVDGKARLSLRLDYVREPERPLRVYGEVRDQFGDLVTEGSVQAFDRDLRSEESLGAVPLSTGRYEIRYSADQFRNAEKDTADLVLTVLDTDGGERHRTPVTFNAPAELELNISMQAKAYAGPSEWESLGATLTPLLEDVAPGELREDDQYQDISFLAGDTGTPPLTVAIWSACFRLRDKSASEETSLPAEAFFAFLRQGQPSIFYDALLPDMQHPERRALLEEKILRGLAELTPELQRSLLTKAVADNLVPARLTQQFDDILKTLAAMKVSAAAGKTFGGGKGTVGDLLSVAHLAPEQRTAVLAAFATHTGPLGTFWEQLVEARVLEPAVAQKMRQTFRVGALTRNHVPLVRALVSQLNEGRLSSPRDLAKYDHQAWMTLLQQPDPDGNIIGAPANIDALAPEGAIDQYAVILEQQFERAYPTASFSAKLHRVETAPVTAKTDIVTFLEANPAFQLDRYRVDHYLAEHPEATRDLQDPQGMVAELKTVQRLFKLDPKFASVTTLLDRNIDSAQDIYFLGQGQFLTVMSGSNINVLEAKQLYRKAENAYALALALYADLNQTVIGIQPFGVPTLTPAPDQQEKIAALPNLRTLFGSLDYCECPECRSVYSPAAYFVDTMRFLGDRGTHGTGVNAGKTVRQVLLQRRPDLGEIELSCENTQTPLPYIDLVNEILEDVVAPPASATLNAAIEPDLVAGTVRPAVLAGVRAADLPLADDAHVYDQDSRGAWVLRDGERTYAVVKTGATLTARPTRQTFLSAAELRANPEYTNENAYAKLRGEVFPLRLPFDLWLLQTRAYLDVLGVPQPRLLELFQQRAADDTTLAPTDTQIDCAWLGISWPERAVLVGGTGAKQSWEYWGLAEMGNTVPNPDNPADPTVNLTGTWIQVLSHVPVLLNRTGLTYPELLQLLDTRYVNPDRSVSVVTADSNAANCDLSTFTVRNLTQAALDRSHRFVRLWRRVGCTMWELDLLLPDADPDPSIVDKQITDAVLSDLSEMIRLRDRTGLDLRVLGAFYRGIDHTVDVDHGQEGAPPVQTLYQRLFRNRLVDAVAAFPSTPSQLTGTIADRVPGILAAFRIKEADLGLILADLSLTPALPLTVDVLSRIHRAAVLAFALSLTVDQFLRLKRLWGQDPFADPKATRAFAELADLVTRSGFSVLELDYLLAHEFTSNSGIALEPTAIATLLRELRDGLQRITDDLARKPEQTKQAYVMSKLGLVPALRKDADQAVALALIDGTWQGTPAERDPLIEKLFARLLDPAEAKTKLAAIPGGLSPADRQAAGDARFDYVAPALESLLLRSATDDFVRQQVAGAFGLNEPSAAALLDGLRVPGTTDTLLRALNDVRLTERLPDGTYRYALGEANFPRIFTALRLLHKDALIVSRLSMKAADVLWWLAPGHATGLGWPEAGALPVDTTTSVGIGTWRAMVEFFGWKASLPVSDLTAFDFAAGVLDAGHTSAATLADLARLTAVDAADLTVLATTFHWVDSSAAFDVVKERLRQSANLLRLAEAAEVLRRLGVNAARAVSWAKAEPTAADAESLKQTVKAKYDLMQWQQVITPLQDQFREAKRAALVDWLVAHPDQGKGQAWSDADGLYSTYLIDVEMGACMLTSRLKQATASAQMFVQRCLLNLEEDILTKTDLDPKWNQWKWMRRYRVWEANRKVFLYPENWIEPELRDEKSPFFLGLEQALLQQEVTAESAEDAYRAYLEKLDKVANLEIRTMFDEPLSQNEDVLHVFGRTRSSSAPEHFYRRRINGARWTAWEKVELDITGNHLTAAVHNRRLHLFWPQFLEKADQPATVKTPDANVTMKVEQPVKYWEVRQFWSELKQTKWTPKVLSDSFHTVYQGNVGGLTDNLSFRARLAPQIQLRLFQHDGSYAPFSLQQFEKLGRQITAGRASNFEYLVCGAESGYVANLIQHQSNDQYLWYGSVEETGKPHFLTPHENALAIPLLHKVDAGLTYSVIDSQARGFPSASTFFTWDPRHTYCVDFIYRTDWSYFSRAWHETTTSSFRYFIHYHPFVELFTKELNIWGIKGLLNRRIQIDPASVPGSPALFIFSDYVPDNANVAPDRPVEDVDFSYAGAYSPYNWELFFHVPFFIANRLAANQRFEEALEWYHYIFDPTSTDNATADPDTPQQKFWLTKPFYLTTKADYQRQKIENILLAIAKGDAELRAQVNEWRDHPFNPHLIARMRTVAYQKNVLIKYLEMLIAWGDQLFSQDTIESVNEAAQLYLLASEILGTRPRSVPRRVENPVKTYYQLEREGVDPFGNVLKQVENLLPAVPYTGSLGADAPELPRLEVLYFGIPHNAKLLTLWDTVADRLFKIRHCMNLAGVVRQLPLFEPPIDPAALVRATAAGLDIGSALSDLNATLPLYRLTFTLARAQEVCAKVEALGTALLAALEKRDAEGLARLRSGHERTMLDLARLVKSTQIDDAMRTKEGLELAKTVIQARRDHYQKQIDDGWNGWEKACVTMTGVAMGLETAGTIVNTLSASISLVPDADVGAAGFGATPTVKLKFGGMNIANSAGKTAEVLKGIAAVLSMGAGMSATIAGYERRAQDWELQKTLADNELQEADKQIAAAEIRRLIAVQELANQDKQIEHAQEQDEYLRTKFTNQELYDWMVAQLSTVYFQSYQLAYDLAKRAERCFRYELGLSDSSYIRFGYWDSLKKGLLSGEHLSYDLKRMETAYQEQNRREYELTKHVSLAQLDPVALLKLRQNGECFVDLPETLFDMDYPGHYFRRLKSVGVSMPSVAGPYTTVACTLTLTSNSVRTNTSLLSGKYDRDRTAADPRFADERAGIQSIAISSGQNDSGLFELNFRDERYLPFEGAGAISSWHLKLNKELPPFDFTTISDVILHVDYTAREGGELLRSKAAEEINKKLNEMALSEKRRGLFRVLDLKREYPDQWYRFLHPEHPADDQSFVLNDLAQRLPYFTRGFPTKKASKIEVVAHMEDGATYKVQLSPLGTRPADLLSLETDPTYQGLHRAAKDLTGNEVPFGTWTLKLQADGAADFKSLPADAIQELFLIVNYTID
ncbi:neuraminidase-like domain-containing protein [Streptomyces sp. NPDC057620]|uniref:Tc toxin subunit A-related protein n=1 Tax=Streptomyces sp. NPDC057620 TaxID=3346185 RepID=UPI003690EFF9